MASDHKKPNVLLVLARRARADEDLSEPYLRAAESIGSEFEYNRAVRPTLQH